jgi:hypothetical protein
VGRHISSWFIVPLNIQHFALVMSVISFNFIVGAFFSFDSTYLAPEECVILNVLPWIPNICILLKGVCVMDQLMIKLLHQQFQLLYLFTIGLLCTVLTVVSESERFPGAASQYLIFSKQCVIALLFGSVLHLDTFIDPIIRLKLWPATITFGSIIAAALYKIIIERFTDDVYSQSVICIYSCTRMRTICLQGFTSAIAFLTKFLVLRLIHRHRPVIASFAMLCHETDSIVSVKALVPSYLVVAGGVRMSATPRFRDDVVRDDAENLLVTMGQWQRQPFPMPRLCASIARARAFPFVAALGFCVYTCADIAGWIDDAAVASLIIVAVLCLGCVELSRIDVRMCRIIFTRFDACFVLGNMLIFLILAAVSPPANAQPLAITANILARSGLVLWALVSDSFSSSGRRRARAVGISCACLTCARIILLQSVAPQVSSQSVCLVYCSELNTLAMGSLLNVLVFLLQVLVQCLLHRTRLGLLNASFDLITCAADVCADVASSELPDWQRMPDEQLQGGDELAKNGSSEHSLLA